MELKEYLRIIKHWAWLMVLGLILGGAGGFYASDYQTPVYQTSTRVMIMRPAQESVSDYTYLSAQQLTQTYIQLVTTSPVLEAASVELGYEIKLEQISVQQIRDTQVIQLTVEDENPEHAVQIANVLVAKLIEQNDIFQAGRFNSAEASLQEQIHQVEAQISGLQTVISQISNQNLQDQIVQLEAQITPLALSSGLSAGCGVGVSVGVGVGVPVGVGVAVSSGVGVPVGVGVAVSVGAGVAVLDGPLVAVLVGFGVAAVSVAPQPATATDAAAAPAAASRSRRLKRQPATSFRTV